MTRRLATPSLRVMTSSSGDSREVRGQSVLCQKTDDKISGSEAAHPCAFIFEEVNLASLFLSRKIDFIHGFKQIVQIKLLSCASHALANQPIHCDNLFPRSCVRCRHSASE